MYTKVATGTHTSIVVPRICYIERRALKTFTQITLHAQTQTENAHMYTRTRTHTNTHTHAHTHKHTQSHIHTHTQYIHHCNPPCLGPHVGGKICLPLSPKGPGPTQQGSGPEPQWSEPAHCRSCACRPFPAGAAAPWQQCVAG